MGSYFSINVSYLCTYLTLISVFEGITSSWEHLRNVCPYVYTFLYVSIGDNVLALVCYCFRSYMGYWIN